MNDNEPTKPKTTEEADDALDHTSDAPEEGAYHSEKPKEPESEEFPPENERPSEAAGEDFS